MNTCISLIFQKQEDPVSHTLRVMTWTIHLVALVSVSPRELRRTQLQLLAAALWLSCSSHSFRQFLHVMLEEHSRCAWWLQKSKVGQMVPRLIDSRRSTAARGTSWGGFFSFLPLLAFAWTVTQEEWEIAIQESFLLNYELEWKQFSEAQTCFHVEEILFP